MCGEPKAFTRDLRLATTLGAMDTKIYLYSECEFLKNYSFL
jgi:hypothetical protein